MNLFANLPLLLVPVALLGLFGLAAQAWTLLVLWAEACVTRPSVVGAAAAGQPLLGLRVDLWHCDAQGRYWGFGGQGDDRALDLAGRTTHIYLKVIVGTRAVLTTQFFLPNALSEFLYTRMPGYRCAKLRDTLNSVDGIAPKSGETMLGAVRETRERCMATLALLVDPAASPAIGCPPPGSVPFDAAAPLGEGPPSSEGARPPHAQG